MRAGQLTGLRERLGLAICGEVVEDRVGGLVPDERLGVVVPVGDPGADRRDQLSNGSVSASLDPRQAGTPRCRREFRAHSITACLRTPTDWLERVGTLDSERTADDDGGSKSPSDYWENGAAVSTRHPLRDVGVLICIAAALLGSSAAAATSQPTPPEPQAVPAIQPLTGDTGRSAAGRWAPYPGDTATPMATSAPISAGGCTYLQVNDDPHLSSGDVSIHGWWQRYSGTCPSQNKVTVGLQAYRCDVTCYWVTVATGSGTYYQGPGSGKWANARRRCAASSAPIGWRGWTDVDLIGINDPSGVTYSNYANYYCTPG